ncbi:holdfast anchor protein HfaD [Henriciella marina]|uniref:holdfast anchor protein HfaD n=1 Tax=Henriciella marina TaxID=453851 RepID=UPI0003627581|nr:holdfast anchor protein HfaD [Henriciella marina]
MPKTATRLSALFAIAVSTSAMAAAQDWEYIPYMGDDSAAADAQSSSTPATGTIDQVQFGDVWADMDVQLPEHTPNGVSTSTTVGNLANATRHAGDIDSEVRQSFDATSRATNSVRGYSVGTGVSTTTAYANASSAGTNYGANSSYAQQEAAGSVEANSRIELYQANQVASASTAVANVSTNDNNDGFSIADQTQYSAADVTSETDADMWQNGTSASFATTAGGNASSSTGYTSTNYNRALQKTEDGTRISGSTDVYMKDGTNVTAATNSFGNSATVHNEWGYATLGIDGAPTKQDNQADVDAQSYVTLDHWSGYANSSSYGVGNSALISNVGSDTVMYADQSNSGTVYSYAKLDGASWTGGTGVVTSTAVGNAATATVCNFCSEGAVGGRVNQVNTGAVIAQGQANTNYGGGIYGSASAIGNAATIQSLGTE